MEQGSSDWLKWRQAGIGASEMAAVMGLSPYSTPHKIWLEKTGRTKGQVTNFAMLRGTELEPRARALYELLSMEDMKPAICEHPKYSWLRCSLDGRSDDGKRILEIKVPSRETHESAKKGEIPLHYRIQIQHQLMVTGADLCYFFTYSDKDETHSLNEVLPDLKLQAHIFLEAEHFWNNYVLADIPPPLTEDDEKVVDGDIFEKLFDQASSGDDQAKVEIIKLADHVRVRFGRHLLTKLKNKSGKFIYRLTSKKEV